MIEPKPQAALHRIGNYGISEILPSQLGPRDSFDHAFPKQMKKTLILVADPEIPRTVASDGMHDPARRAVYGNKPAILEVGNPSSRGDPNSSAIILKEGGCIVWQSAVSLAVDRNLAVIPSVQAIGSTEPNAAIPGRQDRPNAGIGQTLLDRNRRDGEVSKAVEAIQGGDPDIAFTILKETSNGVAGETVRPRKLIRPSLVHMQEPSVSRSNPQTAIAIPEQVSGLQLGRSPWKRIHLGFPANELPDSAERGDQDCAVVAFDQSLDFERRTWHRIEFRRTWLPSPQSSRMLPPRDRLRFLIQGEHSAAETAVLSVALGAALPDRAESPCRSHPPASPYRSFTIL